MPRKKPIQPARKTSAGKAKKTVVPTPQNLMDAANFVRQIGEVEREIEKANSEMNDDLEDVKRPFVEQVEKHQQRLALLVEGLYAFAQGHRNELTDNGKKKTVVLPTGTFSWRMTPKAVSIKGKAALIANLKRLGLGRFIRTKEEVDKEAMLKEEEVAAAVDGVTIEQREEFVVRPQESKAEVSAITGKQALKLALSSSSSKSLV